MNFPCFLPYTMMSRTSGDFEILILIFVHVLPCIFGSFLFVYCFTVDFKTNRPHRVSNNQETIILCDNYGYYSSSRVSLNESCSNLLNLQ